MTTKKRANDLAIARGTLAATVVVALSGAWLGMRQADAKPEYAKKEGKPCSYCHVNPSGGGKKTDAGVYYGAHGHSFAGYAAAGAAPAAMPSPAAKPSPKPSAKPAAKATAKPAVKKAGKPTPKPSATPKK